MGLFNGLFKKKQDSTFPLVLGAAASGVFVPMSEIEDDVFKEGILGTCCGINPIEGKVYSPIDGTIVQVSDTLHAIGIVGESGIEVLVHVGINTVDMNGDGFGVDVILGEQVRKGQLILTMDLDKIKSAGHADTVITIVTNTTDFSSVEVVAKGDVSQVDDLLVVHK